MKKSEIAIVAFKCKKCGKLHYPYHDRCLACKGREFEEIRPQGNARLLTFTRIYNLPWGFDQRYLTIGVVEFENGINYASYRLESSEAEWSGSHRDDGRGIAAKVVACRIGPTAMPVSVSNELR